MREQSVLVVGGGIAGMAVGMHLVELGHRVYLVDAAPGIGGSMHLLDHTFPTDSCGICLMLPRQPSYCPTFECERREGVELRAYSELVGLTGQGGDFRAKLWRKPRYVDLERCTGCGVCGEVCPVVRPHDYEGWLAPVKAIYRPAGLRVVPDGWLIDMGYCTRCGACVAACPEGAVDLGMAGEEEEIAVGAVVLAPGFAPFDARRKGEYGYGVYANVLTSLEFERMVSLAGSRRGALVRPSDGGRVRRLALVQCVGSRDWRLGMGYCSSVCCLYTAKQVGLAKKVAPEVEVTVFHMDLRAMGKGMEGYLERVRAMDGVRYCRAMPSRVHWQPGTEELVVRYVGERGELVEEEFDLVVLAVGLTAPGGMRAVAERIGVELNGYGFAEGEGGHPTRTGRAGVFVAGAFREPKDIPETVIEAAAVAAEVSVFLGGGRERREEVREAAFREVAEEEPRVGVWVVDGEEEREGLDLEGLVAWAAGLPGVVLARRVREEAEVERAIEEARPNRVVVVDGGRRWELAGWEAMMRRAGLDPRLLVRVNLREEVVRPHRGRREEMQAKAEAMVGMAVAGLRAMGGVGALALGGRQGLTRRALVVGGGAAGMAAALALAGLGVEVDLVERGQELGGQWRRLRYQLGGVDPAAMWAEWEARLKAEPRIRVHLGTEVRSVVGGPGAYRTVLGSGGRAWEVEHGVVVLATGGRPVAVREYLYGEHGAVLTQRELEERLASRGAAELAEVGTVVMVQCVGSREPGRRYCSRVCCSQAVKNALKLKELKPEVGVYILYREMRTYGFREEWYQAAREAGVVFLRYEWPQKPEVEVEGEKVVVRLVEEVTGQEVELRADRLVLSVGIEAEGGAELALMWGVECEEEGGFYREEHEKMKPLDLGEGRYVAGLARSPCALEEAIEQGQGAALRAAVYLAEGELREAATAVWVNERLCSFCGLCVEACPYGARRMNEEIRVAEVVYPLCRGCGVCAVVCPNKATQQKTFEPVQLFATLEMALI